MKEIPLTQGKFALVDDDDFEYLNQWKWKTNKGRHTYYAARNIYNKGKYKTFLMHRVILNLTDKVQVDHKDGNGLNNQKSNIRTCSNNQNQGNKIGWGKSKYKGVSFVNGGYIQAYININKRQSYLGVFDDEESAARAYDKKAVEIFGEFAKLNFPYD